MRNLRRRAVLTIGAGTLLTGGAGCLDVDEDEDLELLVTNTQLIHQEGQDRFSYPEDVLVRVGLENEHGSSREGTLVITLTYDPGTGAEDIEAWEITDDIQLTGITATANEYIFEDVYREGRDLDNYTVEAWIEEA